MAVRPMSLAPAGSCCRSQRTPVGAGVQEGLQVGRQWAFVVQQPGAVWTTSKSAGWGTGQDRIRRQPRAVGVGVVADIADQRHAELGPVAVERGTKPAFVLWEFRFHITRLSSWLDRSPRPAYSGADGAATAGGSGGSSRRT